MSGNTVAGRQIASKSVFSYLWSLKSRVQSNQETTPTYEAIAQVTHWSRAICLGPSFGPP